MKYKSQAADSYWINSAYFKFFKYWIISSNIEILQRRVHFQECRKAYYSGINGCMLFCALEDGLFWNTEEEEHILIYSQKWAIMISNYQSAIGKKDIWKMSKWSSKTKSEERSNFWRGSPRSSQRHLETVLRNKIQYIFSLVHSGLVGKPLTLGKYPFKKIYIYIYSAQWWHHKKRKYEFIISILKLLL